MTAAAVERLLISGPQGALQAVVEEAAAGADGVRNAAAGGRYAVLCHPHPLFGGTMDNKVVTTLARAMHQLGIPTIRFNFRGVGASEGVFDAGAGETADALNVCEWGAGRWPGRGLVVCGFSFGAYVAFNLAQRVPVVHLVTIAPPVAMFDFSGLETPQCPWLVVQGDADDVVDPRSVIDWVGSLGTVSGAWPPARLVVMPAAGHFFHGRLPELCDAVIDAVRGG